jgi:hypothetical protein
MSLRRLVGLNAALVISVCMLGLLTDEPYWRSVGHGPWMYDYLFWCALALNGPSGLLADWLSFALRLEDNVRFAAQYGLWELFLVPQWYAYAALARWAAGTPTRSRTLYATSAVLFVIGCVGSVHVWFVNRGPTEYFVDIFFWPVRIAGAALAGVCVSVLLARMRSNPPSRGRSQAGFAHSRPPLM